MVYDGEYEYAKWIGDDVILQQELRKQEREEAELDAYIDEHGSGHRDHGNTDPV